MRGSGSSGWPSTLIQRRVVTAMARLSAFQCGVVRRCVLCIVLCLRLQDNTDDFSMGLKRHSHDMIPKASKPAWAPRRAFSCIHPPRSQLTGPCAGVPHCMLLKPCPVLPHRALAYAFCLDLLVAQAGPAVFGAGPCTRRHDVQVGGTVYTSWSVFHGVILLSSSSCCSR